VRFLIETSTMRDDKLHHDKKHKGCAAGKNLTATALF